MRRFIIDTDAASDDAVALILALREKNIRVEAITVVAGAMSVDKGCVNARVALEIADRYMPPVYSGMTRPLWKTPITGENAHGEDGLSDIGLAHTDLPLGKGHAVNKIIEMAKKYDDLEIITLGPLTNIAMAIMIDGKAMQRIKRITAMGGQYRMPNPITANAEYNIWCDAESRDIVLQSGIPITFVPLDACYGVAEITRDDRAKLLSFGTRCGDFIVKANSKLLQFNLNFYNKDIISLPDPSAVAACLCKGVVLEKRICNARCETKSDLGYGQLIYDFNSDTERKVTVVTRISGEKFKEYLFEKSSEN
jgi:purine nucleosidase